MDDRLTWDDLRKMTQNDFEEAVDYIRDRQNWDEYVRVCKMIKEHATLTPSMQRFAWGRGCSIWAAKVIYNDLYGHARPALPTTYVAFRDGNPKNTAWKNFHFDAPPPNEWEEDDELIIAAPEPVYEPPFECGDNDQESEEEEWQSSGGDMGKLRELLLGPNKTAIPTVSADPIDTKKVSATHRKKVEIPNKCSDPIDTPKVFKRVKPKPSRKPQRALIGKGSRKWKQDNLKEEEE